MTKISVKVEMTPSEGQTDLDMVAEALDEALGIAGEGYDSVWDKFITMRFDELREGGVAATVSFAEKRDN